MTAGTATGLSRDDIRAIHDRPLLELVFDAAQVHREFHEPSTVQCASLLSIKTGACPEDCSYCPQSAHYNTELEREPCLCYSQGDWLFSVVAPRVWRLSVRLSWR